MRLRLGLLIPVALAATLAAGVTAASASSTVVLDRGHVDVGVGFEDGALNVHVHDETNDVEHDPADVHFVAPPAARTTVPDDPAFGFLGDPGGRVWILPEVENPELLFLGIGTEELEPGVFAGDSVTLRVLRVRGPGSFSVFTSDPFGAPQVLINSRDGLPDSLALPVATHLHANWAFTARGTYRVLVQATATLAGGGAIRSPLAILTFCVQ